MCSLRVSLISMLVCTTWHRRCSSASPQLYGLYRAVAAAVACATYLQRRDGSILAQHHVCEIRAPHILTYRMAVNGQNPVPGPQPTILRCNTVLFHAFDEYTCVPIRPVERQTQTHALSRVAVPAYSREIEARFSGHASLRPFAAG